MFDIKKLLLIDAVRFIPGETQDDPLRVAIALPEFGRIPKAGHITEYRCTVRPATLRHSTTQFVIVSLCCVCLRHEINLLRRSFSNSPFRLINMWLSRQVHFCVQLTITPRGHKVVYKKENEGSFSISLNFYQTILEWSPQTRFMYTGVNTGVNTERFR